MLGLSNNSVLRVRRVLVVCILSLHQFLWLSVFFVAFQTSLLVLSIVIGFFLVLGVELGHHRYFSHRAFKTGRIFQFILGIWATAAFQRDVLWWSSMHRQHHRYADTEKDPHTPFRKNGGGFIHAAIAWGIAKRNADVDVSYVKDLMDYPEIKLA